MPRRAIERLFLTTAALAGVLWRLRRRIVTGIVEILGLLLVIVGVAMWSGSLAVLLTGVIMVFIAERWD